jgi:Fe-S cluster biogenesis protein NfuA
MDNPNGNGATPQTTNAPPANDLFARLEAFIDSDVRPFLQQDGGDIELKAVDDGIVKVNLHGACGTCPSSIMTLQFGVERRLKEVFPAEVRGLELVNPMPMPGGHGGPHPAHY